MRSLLLGLCLSLCFVGRAHAQTPAWSVGVTDAQKANAQKFLEQGNEAFLDKRYAEALEKYKAAVGEWDHPAIRFNIVRCLIQLERPVDASDNLKLALKYGAAPLEEAVYSEALNYEKLLATQIADLSVSCTQPGVKLTLDGQPLATCPASETRRVSPGSHQIVGTKEGLLTSTVEVVVLGGKQQTVKVTLDPLAKAARVEHRWATWKPWVVFGSGFAVAALGGLYDLNAQSKMDRFDGDIALMCSITACPEGSVDFSRRDDAERQSNIAIGVMAVGGAAIATGVVMLYMNRGRTVYPTTIEKITPSVTPMPGGAALTVRGAF